MADVPFTSFSLSRKIDTEKQQAMNLFLGVFQPKIGRPHFWDLSSDYHLHDPRLLPGYMAPQ